MQGTDLLAICSAPDSEALLDALNHETNRLRERYHDVNIKSVSHDVMMQASGAYVWTALINCEVKDPKDT